MREKKNRRWMNPFIKRLTEFENYIISGERGNEEALIPRIEAHTKKHTGLILELCSGSGAHMLELAHRNEHALIIGVELRYKRLVRTAEKGITANLQNFVLLQIDAEQIARVLPPKSLDKIYINFPDPWDGKTRWQDKYLLSQSYLEILANLLKDQGSFNYKTDHRERFFQVHEAIGKLENSYKLIEFTEDLHQSEFKNNNILTEFERLFVYQKKPVFYLKALKL